MIKVAIFGGSFNPPHIGHQKVLEHIMSLHMVDRVYVIPAVQNPFKDSYGVSFDERLEMCELAFAGMPDVSVNGIEKALSDLFGEPSVRTIDLLDYLTYEIPVYEEEIRYIPIIGSDCLNEFHKWKEHERILDEYGLIVVGRPGTQMERINHPNIEYVDVPDMPEISSSRIRKDIAHGKCIDGLVNPKVNEYINKRLVGKYGK